MKNIKVIKRLLCLFFISIQFLSCKLKVEQQYSSAQFSVIDSLIVHNQLKDASKELKKISKKTYDIWTVLGVYKRYIKLEDKKSAEKVLVKAIKKNPENLELRGVYTKFLIDENRLEEACNISKKLSGSKYGSIYSEAILKYSANLSVETQNPENYFDTALIPVYADAYNSTKNTIWLRNCAVIHLLQGEYEAAVKIVPQAFSEVNDSYFWSLVLYDSRKYEAAVTLLESAKNLLKNYQNPAAFSVTMADLISLESDCCILVKDFDSAEKFRQTLISGIEESNFSQDKRKVLPVIYMDSALYALENENTDEAVDLLFVLVNNWPDYIPGLLKYADLAYELNLKREESYEVQVLRNAGIQSLEMEKLDSRRTIPLSDALYRLENAYDKTKNQLIQQKIIELKYKQNPNLTVKDKTVDLWKLLENNLTLENSYSKELVKYTLYFLLDTRQFNDAETLFYKFMESEYSCSVSSDFWSEVYNRKSDIDEEFIEFAAYFALLNNYYEKAKQFYEFCVYDRDSENENEISQSSSYCAVMNLANIYYSSGEKEKAKKLYVELAGSERNSVYRSEIFYRLANIYVEQDEIQNAKRAVDYAITLNSDNTRAQLLKVKLQ